MKKIALLFILFIGFSGYSQILYKKIQGSYENPIIGNVTIEGYELTYRGYTYIYQTETDYSSLDNYVRYNYPGEEGTISVRLTHNGTKYLMFNDGEYILIPKGQVAQEDIEAKRNAEANSIAQENAAAEGARKKNLDALMGGFSDGYGKADGDPYAFDAYSVNGINLANRKALSKPKPNYPCNEEGRVVVSISVDQSGRVIDAQAGTTGSTNSAPCLLKEAKEAALKTKFNADSNAPSKQVGQIIYNFSLSD